MTGSDSLHSLLDYECLPLWLTWFWFTSRSLLQLRCRLVNTPQLNTELSYEWLTTASFHSLSLSLSLSLSQSHIAPDVQSVCMSWCRAPSGAHDQLFILSWKLLSCPYGAPSLTRGRVCRLSVIVGSISSLSFVQLFTILPLKSNRMYNI
jgi:hypothetical protein